MDRSGLEVHILNLSKDGVYVELSNDTCNNCEIMRDILNYCDGHKSAVFYKKLHPLDSTTIAAKNYGRVKIYVINVDSLNQNCNKNHNYNITNKKWIKVMLNDTIAENAKECSFVIHNTR